MRKGIPAVIAGTGAIAVALAVVSRDLGGGAQPWAVAPVLGAALVVAGRLQLEFRLRREIQALDLFEAVLAPVIFLFAGPVAIILAGSAKAVSQALLHVRPVKAAFNVAQWSAAAAAASVVYLTYAERGDPAGLLPLLLAMLTVLLVNDLAMIAVLRVAEPQPLGALVRGWASSVAPGYTLFAVNAGLGIVFALALASAPASAPLVFIPLVLAHRAQHANMTLQADKARLEGLHRATAVLAAPVDPVDALGAFVDEVRHAFSAGTAELVVFDPASVVRAGRAGNDAASLELASALVEADASVVRVRTAGAAGEVASELAELVHATGHEDALIAPLLRGGRVTGALCVYDRSGFEGFEEGEEAVLGLLAADAARALEKHDLLDAVVGERQKLSEIVERSSDGIFTVAADGRVASWNPAMEGITGFAADDMVGSVRIAALRSRNEHGVDVALESWAGGPPLPGDVRILTHHGEERWLSCSYAVSPDGATLVVMARDVTAAREVERLKDDFVATVSHELRTPLTAITGFTHLLLEPPGELSDDDRLDSLTRISTSARRLERMVENLLELSRIEAQPHLPMAEVDLRSVLRTATEELAASVPGRDVVVRAPGGPLPVLGVQLSIERILANLLLNAAKYAHDGTIEVRVTTDGAGTSVTVADEGPGIPERARATVFERFVRLDTRHQQAGTGLGLYIARQLAHHMGATLTLEPSTGRGAAFTLRLRAAVDGEGGVAAQGPRADIRRPPA